MSLTFTDIFCGAGGSSIGLTAAGFELTLAANHWDRAIETHAANFRDAEHLCADVNNYDMRRLPRTDMLWASPICTESSPAGRRTRRVRGQVRGQDILLEEFGSLPRAGMDRTRATFHDVIRAAEVHRYTAVLVENVPEVVEQWELFDWWVDGMIRLGYRVQYVSVSSAHIAGPGNPPAPQWRDRLYLIFTRVGVPLPDVDPRPLAWCPVCGRDVSAMQSWRNPTARRVGRYRRQYAYRCPNIDCRHGIVEPYVLPAAAAIDWTNLGPRIGDRRRPLAANTLRRIQTGLAMFAAPVMVNSNHDDDRTHPAHATPLSARTTRIGDGLACPPMLVPAGGTWNTRPSSVNEPMRTRTVRDMEAVVAPAPFLTVLRSHATARPVAEPMVTVCTGNHQYLTTPAGAFYVKNYGGHADPRHLAKPVAEPFGTVTTTDHHALVVPYYRTGKAKPVEAPFDTITVRDRFALVTGTELPAVEDCRYRMVQPRESLRAQRFPDTYIVHGNQGEQTMQAGNAVSANVAQWLGHQLATVLGGSVQEVAE
jgi:DNA (cytosine-5)-methyltransferase 1